MAAKPAKAVFITGSSFSGTTMLGLVLGSDDTAFFAGEVKMYMRRHDPKQHQVPSFYVCSCGKRYEACPFWTSVHSRYGSEHNLNPAPGFSLSNIRLLARLLIPGHQRTNTQVSDHSRLLAAIHNVAHADDPRVVYVVDSSKALGSLEILSRAPNIDLSVIHLIRDGLAVASSFKGRGSSALYGMVSWATVNAFLAYFLQKNRIRTLRMDYGALCAATPEQLARINVFLGSSLRGESVTQRVREQGYHVFGGNKNVRWSFNKFPGIRYQANLERLNLVERSVASLLVSPLNRWLGVTPSSVLQRLLHNSTGSVS